MSWLDWLPPSLVPREARVRASGRAWAARLRDYAPYEAPHPGPSMNWTLAQAQENLAYLLAQREARLAQLDGLLAEAGMAIAPVLAGAPPGPLLAQLRAWRLAEWPGLRASVPDARVPLASDITSRAQAHIAYSVVMDVAMLLGEIVVRRRAPTVDWALDLADASVAEDEQGLPWARPEHTDSWKRPVVLIRRQQPPLCQRDRPLDVEGMVLGTLGELDSYREQWQDEWSRFVNEVLTGAFERI